MQNTLSFSALQGSRVHLGVCGSVAAYKALDLLRSLIKQDIHVTTTMTEAAKQFVTPLSFSSLGAEYVYPEMFSPEDLPFEHLAPGTGSDCFIIAPASATTIAKLAHGIADDMLSAQALAFSGQLLIAPAMNPRMWANPATQENIQKLKSRGHIVITPKHGLVACGEEGTGKLASVDTIVWHVLRACAQAKNLNTLAGERVMVTLGPTREQWDCVRFWSNLSTGLMGTCLAIAAWVRGAEVHAVTGPTTLCLPEGIHTYPVISASEMFEQANELWAAMTVGIFTAAVADFSPEPFGAEKFKKTESATGFSVNFVPNKDILATLASKKNKQYIIGFAAETTNLEEQTRKKLVTKKADIIVGNRIGQKGTGFASTTNNVFICTAIGEETHITGIDKASLAWSLLDRLCTK